MEKKIIVLGICLLGISASILYWVFLGKNSSDKDTESTNSVTTETYQNYSTKESSSDRIILSDVQESVTLDDSKNNHELIKVLTQSFVKEYYTYTNYGDNFENYRPFLSSESQEIVKQRMEEQKRQVNASGFVKSSYDSSEIFISNPDSEQSSVLCNITFYMDVLDGEDRYKETLKNSIDLLLTVVQEGEEHRIKDFQRVTITKE